LWELGATAVDDGWQPATVNSSTVAPMVHRLPFANAGRCGVVWPMARP